MRITLVNGLKKCREPGQHRFIGIKLIAHNGGNAFHPTLTAVGVTWLDGFQFEIKVIPKLTDSTTGQSRCRFAQFISIRDNGKRPATLPYLRRASLAAS